MASSDAAITAATRRRIRAVEDFRSGARPEISVIVVAYRDPERLDACLDSLRAQSERRFEVVIAHNGGSVVNDSWQRELDVACVHLNRNYRQLIARNVGRVFARAPLLYFVDDDSTLDPDTLANLVRFYASSDVVASRGRMRFRTDTIYNAFAGHYDLGPEVIAGQLHENGLAIRAEAHDRFDGYDESIEPGYEGRYWLHQLVTHYGRDRVAYYPGAVLYTDYGRSLWHFLSKTWRYARCLAEMEESHGDWIDLFQREHLNDAVPVSVPGQKAVLAQLLRRLQLATRWLARRFPRRRRRGPE